MHDKWWTIDNKKHAERGEADQEPETPGRGSRWLQKAVLELLSGSPHQMTHSSLSGLMLPLKLLIWIWRSECWRPKWKEERQKAWKSVIFVEGSLPRPHQTWGIWWFGSRAEETNQTLTDLWQRFIRVYLLQVLFLLSCSADALHPDTATMSLVQSEWKAAWQSLSHRKVCKTCPHHRAMTSDQHSCLLFIMLHLINFFSELNEH